MEVIETFKVTLDFEVSVDPETGEIKTNCVKKSINKTNFSTEPTKPKRKAKIADSPEPLLMLDDNKYKLTQAAVELMGIKPEDRLDIKYVPMNNKTIPVIATDDVWGTHNGCRLTKTYTVSCKGSKNTELAKYGKEFKVVAHPEKVRHFLLQTGDPVSEDIADIEEEIGLSLDVDLDELINDPDVKEVSSSIFKL